MTAALEFDPWEDPREFRKIKCSLLRIDQRKQREVDPEKIAKIVNEFAWPQFEALTVAPSKQQGFFDVVEGQHRALAAQQKSKEIGQEIFVPCMILSDRPNDKQQSQIALTITQTRRGHSALEQWQLRFNAGHPHEIEATKVLTELGLRVGKGQSATTISAVATVRRIVHGGHFTPDVGAELLRRTLELLMGAFPTYDHESNASRWDRYLLLAVSTSVMRWPELDATRYEKALRVRPAGQWVNLGKGTEGPSANEAILQSVMAEYNRNLRRGRLE